MEVIILLVIDYEQIKNATEEEKNTLLKGKDLNCADLSEMDLSGFDLTSANLTSANLRSTDLRNTDLTSANLTYANLDSSSIFTNCNFSNANLTYAHLDSCSIFINCNFSNANLTDADVYSGTKFINCDFKESKMYDLYYVDSRTPIFKNCLIKFETEFNQWDQFSNDQKDNLIYIFNDNEKIKKVGFEIFVDEEPEKGVWSTKIQTRNTQDHDRDAKEWTYGNILSQDLKGKDLTDAYLPNLNFKNKDLSDTKFINCDLRRSIFVGTNICGADFTDAKLDGAIIGGGIYDDNTKGLTDEQKEFLIHKDKLSSICSPYTSTPCLTSQNNIFDINANTKIISSNCVQYGNKGEILNITYGNIGLDKMLVGSYSSKIILTNSYMANLDWTDKLRNLTNNQFPNSDFRNTKFGSANLNNTNLTKCDLRGSDLTNVQNLDKAILVGAKWDETTKFPVGFNKTGMVEVK